MLRHCKEMWRECTKPNQKFCNCQTDNDSTFAICRFLCFHLFTMSLEISELEKKVEQKLYQINIALNKSVMLLKELNHLTRENGDFDNAMDTVNEQFQILMSIFPESTVNTIPVNQKVIDDSSVIIEEEVNSDSNV